MNRIRAEETKHEYTMMMNVVSCALGGGNPKDYLNTLNNQMDSPIKVKEKVKFDKNAFERFKLLALGA